MSNTQTIQTIEIDIDDSKLEAFTKFCARHDIDTETTTNKVFHGVSFECEVGEYYVLTDTEAHELCKEYIEETVWAFNASFLSAHMKADADAIKALQNTYKATHWVIRSLGAGGRFPQCFHNVFPLCFHNVS